MQLTSPVCRVRHGTSTARPGTSRGTSGGSHRPPMTTGEHRKHREEVPSPHSLFWFFVLLAHVESSPGRAQSRDSRDRAGLGTASQGGSLQYSSNTRVGRDDHHPSNARSQDDPLGSHHVWGAFCTDCTSPLREQIGLTLDGHPNRRPSVPHPRWTRPGGVGLPRPPRKGRLLAPHRRRVRHRSPHGKGSSPPCWCAYPLCRP